MIRSSISYLCIIFAIGLAVFSLSLPAYRVTCHICEKTGSIKYCTTTIFGKSSERYEISPLESFIASKDSSNLQHHWVRLSSTDYNWLGKSILHADKIMPTNVLAEWVRSYEFDELSDKAKHDAYCMLIQTDEWSDDDKRRLYYRLMQLKGKSLRDFIEKINVTGIAVLSEDGKNDRNGDKSR